MGLSTTAAAPRMLLGLVRRMVGCPRMTPSSGFELRVVRMSACKSAGHGSGFVGQENSSVLGTLALGIRQVLVVGSWGLPVLRRPTSCLQRL